MELKKIIEAVLFSSSKPVTSKLLKKKLEEYPPDEIDRAIKELTLEYSSLDRAVEITEVAGGFQMKTKPVYKEWVTRFVKEKDVGLSKSMLETLSIIAYKQPVTKKEIDGVRGVDSTRAIKLLLERKLIGIAGKNGDAGKKMVFKTTEKFLELYGLRSLDDLPTYKDLESLELEPKMQGMLNDTAQKAQSTGTEPEEEHAVDGAAAEPGKDQTAEGGETESPPEIKAEDVEVENRHQNGSAKIEE